MKSLKIAAERRQKIAHGVSRGEHVGRFPSPGRGERKKWRVAGFFRRSAALAHRTATHGSRRGLPSIATPWLGEGNRAKIEMRPETSANYVLTQSRIGGVAPTNSQPGEMLRNSRLTVGKYSLTYLYV